MHDERRTKSRIGFRSLPGFAQWKCCNFGRQRDFRRTLFWRRAASDLRRIAAIPPLSARPPAVTVAPTARCRSRFFGRRRWCLGRWLDGWRLDRRSFDGWNLDWRRFNRRHDLWCGRWRFSRRRLNRRCLGGQCGWWLDRRRRFNGRRKSGRLYRQFRHRRRRRGFRHNSGHRFRHRFGHRRGHRRRHGVTTRRAASS